MNCNDFFDQLDEWIKGQPSREAQADGQTRAHHTVPPLTPDHRDESQQCEQGERELRERLNDLPRGPRLMPLVHRAVHSGPGEPEQAQGDHDEQHAP